MISRVFRTKATGTGSFVDWKKFKLDGELEEANPIGSALLTTTIPNPLSDLINFFHEKKIPFKISTIFPNGFLTASFDILITTPKAHILCGRRLVRGLFPLNPIAAEFGKNYDLLFSISGEAELSSAIVETVLSKYESKEITECPPHDGKGDS